MRRLIKYLIPLVALLIACSSEKGKDETSLDSPDRDSLVHLMIATDSVTVFDLLQSNHQIEYKSSAMGLFVTTIDSVENSSAAYWVYSVNSKMIPMASDKHLIGPNDTLRWHLRKSGQ
ncbi:MAG: DUF4430 domain-containing protein [bacterium]|nr:DUF4430 domain-containing protein [bacterium]